MKKKRDNTANVPNLRFPGFEGEWEKYKLGDIMTFKVTNSFSRDDLNYETGSIKNIHYGDIHTKFQALFDITKEVVPYINKEIDLERISDENYCKEGDIIFTDASEDLNGVGKSIEIVNVNKEKLLSGSHTLLARPVKNIFHLGFNGYLFKSNQVRTQIQKESQGTKVLSINVGRISKIILDIPPIQEQRKIASFLTLVDEKIRTQNKIIQQLESLMIGLRQRVFNQELKFKDENNEDFSIWDKVRLENFLKLKSNRNNNSEITRVLSVSNTKGFILQSEQFDNHRVASKNVSNYKIVRKHDIAYNPSRINVGSIAILKDFDEGIVSPMYVVFTLKDTMNLIFFKNLIATHIFKHLVKVGCSGSVRDTLNFDDLKSFKFNIPSLAEQVKIASFLTTVDKKIQIEKDILENLQSQKQYLLQQLFV